MKQLPALVFDIETAPVKANLWRANQEYVPHEMVDADSFVICWSAKWYGGREVASDIVTPAEAKDRYDARVVASLAEMMREAELYIAHNGSRFDLPRINGRLMVLEQEPLTPGRMIDTLTLARRSFDLPYNKLDYLAAILFNDHKLRTEFDLWRRCVLGDEAALRRMLKYNRKDVTLLERVFDRMKPYVNNLPRMFVPTTDREWACPTCGSPNVIKRGHHNTAVGRTQTWFCKDCFRYSNPWTSANNPRAGLKAM